MLGGGGARSAYQAGVLAYVGRRLPDIRIPILTGVSAGAINVGFIASDTSGFAHATETLKRKWCTLTTEEVFKSDPASLFWIGIRWLLRLSSGGAGFGPGVPALVDTRPLHKLLRRWVDTEGIRQNIQRGRLDAVALSALSYQTGRTVTFVDGSVSAAKLSHGVHHRGVRAHLTVDHIMASSAIPLLFPAIKLGQQYYGDGSFRHVAPLSPAIHLGANRILAISGRYQRSGLEARRPEMLGYPMPARILGVLFNSVFLDTLEWDAARLERINQLLAKIPEPDRNQESLRHIDLLVLHPSEDLGRVAAAYEERLPRTLRFFVRGLGSSATRTSDFISYLLFESAYIERLIRLGEHDAERNWPRLSRFLSPVDHPA
ncbi:MAG: patatin-like phospholipase family protein [Gemmatimonadota bacterium]